MFIMPTIPHLGNLRLTVQYRELPEHESELTKRAPLQKWKNDPDASRFHGFAPGNKYYVNGQLIDEQKPSLGEVSNKEFLPLAPRRGLITVPPSDPEYARLCKEQGLDHLLSGLQTPPMANGVHSSPSSAFSQRAFHGANGDLSPPQSEPATVNGHAPSSSTSTTGQEIPLVDGINGLAHVNTSPDVL